LNQDRRAGRIKLRVENTDDLWHLYNLIRPGDNVYALTQRREEKATDKIREKRAEKRRIYLGIRVEKVEFHTFADRLRVHGIILPDQMDTGSYHTLNLEVGREVKLLKQDWQPQDIKRIREAVEAGKRPKVVVVSLDEDEAVVAVLRQYGIQEVGMVYSGRSGKQYTAAKSKKGNYFEEITAVITLQGSDLPLIIAGPGFTKEELLRFGRARYPGIYSSAAAVSTGQSGKVGINEVLKNGAVSHVTEGSRLEYETGLIERFLKELSTSGKAAYGLEEVQEAVRKGAAEIVLITDKALRENRETAGGLLGRAEASGAEVAIISGAHDSGRQLESLGGYAAILRFGIN
ncbi:MAG: mRNA surveillance protein pelota, partial [Thermoplasmata archaeon]|nr:mRNA surveillance protein pelota [Thermoplasmata archaeon]